MHQLHRRNADALLRDFAAQAHRAGEHSAHVGVMSTVGNVESGLRPPREKHRGNHGDVGQVSAAAKRIIEQGHVTVSEVERIEYGSHRHGHRAKMHGHVVAHRDQVAPGGKHGRRIIAAFLDIGRECGAAQGRAHFHGHRVQRLAEHGDFGGIECVRASSTASLHWR